jgi:elongation factor 3
MPHQTTTPPMPPTIAVKSESAGPAPSPADVSKLLDTVFTTDKSQASLDAAYDLTNLLIATVGFRGLNGYGVLDAVRKAATDKKDVGKREGAMFALGALFERFPAQQPLSLVVFLLQNEGSVNLALDGLADKGSAVRDGAQYALDALFANLNAEALAFGLLPILQKYLSKATGKWQGTVGAYALLGKMTEKAKQGMGHISEEEEKDVLREALGKKLELLIPIVEGGMHDLKAEVSWNIVCEGRVFANRE